MNINLYYNMPVSDTAFAGLKGGIRTRLDWKISQFSNNNGQN